MKKAKICLSFLLVIATVLTCVVCLLPMNADAAAADAYVFGDASKLTGLKAEYTVGDKINVAAVGSGNAFVGIYKTMDVGSSYWHYIDTAKGGVGSGVTADVTQGNELYPGEYIVRLMPSDGDHCTATAWAVINIKPKASQSYDANALVQGPEKSKLSVPKATYDVGEAINVSGIGSGKDWIGLYKIGSQTCSKYFYVTTPGSGVAKDLTGGEDLAPGQYVIRLMPNDESAHKTALAWAVITIGMGGKGATVYGDASKLTGLKAEYTVGDKINVAAKASGNAFVGIYKPMDYGSSYWHYVDSAKGGVGSGVTADVTQGNELYPGEYIVRLMPDDGNHTIATSWAKITVKPKSGQSYDASTLVQGPQKNKLSVPKATYQSGEAINVTATGSGDAWVGIYKICTQKYVNYYWVDSAKEGGAGSGVARDVTGGAVLEPGDYVIRLMPSNSEAHKTAIAWAEITVTAAPADVLKKPAAATYKLDNDTDGYAAGTVTVTMPEYSAGNRRDIVMYWANASGKLPGYASLAKFKVTGLTTSFTIPKNVIIPAGATKLLVYAQQTFTGKLSDPITIDLPVNAAFKNTSELVMEFQIISDIHVTTDNNNRGAVNFRKALNDIKNNSTNSQGIFIVGDMIGSRYQTDGKPNVYAAEYANMQAIYDSISGLPNMYLGIGNHDVWNQAQSLAEAEAIFCQYAKLPDGSHATDTSYDFWLNGYHFIFLGTDYFHLLDAKFSDSTLSWLETKLAENRDPERPTFVMLHQSLYNTIAGSLPGEGWHGVAEESAPKLKAILNKFPEVVMFNGHSHWEMDSVMNMYPATSDLNINVFNTASVAYLYTTYTNPAGEDLEGSQGYYLRVYEDKLMVMGRDFITGEWLPSAQYCIEYKAAPDSDIGGGGNNGSGNNGSSNNGGGNNGGGGSGIPEDPSVPGATYDPTDPNAPSVPGNGESSSNSSKNEGGKQINPILIVCIATAVLAAAGVGVAAFLLLKKKK